MKHPFLLPKAGILALSFCLLASCSPKGPGTSPTTASLEAAASSQSPTTGPDKTTAKDDILHNEFFSAELTSLTFDEADGFVTAVFTFTNITDTAYLKTDEEIQPGGTWTKNVRYTKDQWTRKAQTETRGMIHYRFFHLDQTPLFYGGLAFTIANDESIRDLEIFTDQAFD